MGNICNLWETLLTTVARGHGQRIGIGTIVEMCDLDGDHLPFVGNLAHNSGGGPWAIHGHRYFCGNV